MSDTPKIITLEKSNGLSIWHYNGFVEINYPNTLKNGGTASIAARISDFNLIYELRSDGVGSSCGYIEIKNDFITAKIPVICRQDFKDVCTAFEKTYGIKHIGRSVDHPLTFPDFQL